MISRNLSMAYAELELGNVALEDIILTELDGRKGTIDDFVCHLENSIEALSGARKSCDCLLQMMNDNDFVDLPVLQTVDLAELGEKFMQRKMVSPESWFIVSAMIRRGGFRSAFSFLVMCIGILAEKTGTLLSQVRNLNSAARAGRIAEILEENLPGNIKPAFAELYVAWAKFNNDFLASSILSTEAWYVNTDVGSLVPSMETENIRAA